MIPPFRPYLGLEEAAALFQPNAGAVARFERAFAEAFGARAAVAFPYGRSALWAFLRSVGLEDAEVVMPAYTCSVVAHAVVLSGNQPRFIDIRLSDYNMDLDLLARVIGPRTGAIVATHLFGYPLDLDRLEQIVRDAERRHGRKIWLVQDCAHAFGATWKGRLVGRCGDTALYGLNISKMITSIFGGMLTFQDENLARKVRAWRDLNFSAARPAKNWLRRMYLLAVYPGFSGPGYRLNFWLQNHTRVLNRLTDSYHLDDKIHFPPDHLDLMLDVEAAVGLVQLAKYPEIVKRRRHNAAFYDQYLARKDGWTLPPLCEGATYSHYVVRVPNRNACISAMARVGVHLGKLIQYSVPGLESYGNRETDFPNAALCSRQTVNLPLDAALEPGALLRISTEFSKLA